MWYYLFSQEKTIKIWKKNGSLTLKNIQLPKLLSFKILYISVNHKLIWRLRII